MEAAAGRDGAGRGLAGRGRCVLVKAIITIIGIREGEARVEHRVT